MQHFDAVVIGGGPAGLAAGIAAARAGLSVLLADVHTPPVDKLCGEGLLPDALTALKQLGVNVYGAGPSASFVGISFHEQTHSFAASFSSHPALGVRRTVLHDALRMAAEREGITLRWNTRAKRSGPCTVKVGDETVHCRYIIAADGTHSATRQSAGLSTRASSPDGLRLRHRLASGGHYLRTPWSRFVEVHWSGDVQAYVTPVGSEQVSVAVICRSRQVRAEEALDLFPALKSRLAGAERLGREQGATSAMLQLPRVISTYAEGATILIGESSGSVDAITGEGLSLIFRQALALGEALQSGNLEHYQQEHRRIFRRSRWMARLLLSLSEHPRWRGRVFSVFSEDPRAFENLLRMHTGQQPKIFGSGGCAEVLSHLLSGWQMRSIAKREINLD